MPDGLDVGGKPSQAVGGALFAIENARNQPALNRHPVGDRLARVGKQRLSYGDRLVQWAREVVSGGRKGFGKRHYAAPIS